MLGIYNTPLDFLYLMLTVGIGLLVFFIILLIYNLIRILYGVRSVTEKAQETVELLNHYLWQPIKFFMQVVEKGHKKRRETRDEKEE